MAVRRCSIAVLLPRKSLKVTGRPGIVMTLSDDARGDVMVFRLAQWHPPSGLVDEINPCPKSGTWGTRFLANPNFT
jgi:hypothetical protein